MNKQDRQWVLQRYFDGAWCEFYRFSTAEVSEEDEDSSVFSVAALTFSAGQYCLLDCLSSETSNAFCVGELENFTAHDLELSPCPQKQLTSEVTLVVEDVNEEYVAYTLHNASDDTVFFGCGAWIETSRSDRWYRVPGTVMFEQVSQEAAAGGSYSELLAINAVNLRFTYSVPLCAGKYRVMKPITSKDGGDGYIWSEFTVSQAELHAPMPVCDHILSLVQQQQDDVRRAAFCHTAERTTDEIRVYHPFHYNLQVKTASGWATVDPQQETHIHGRVAIGQGECTPSFSLEQLLPQPAQPPAEYRFLVPCLSAETGLFYAAVPVP